MHNLMEAPYTIHHARNQRFQAACSLITKCSSKQTINGFAVYIFIQNLNAKSGNERLNAEDGNKIRSQPVRSTQQMYINVKKSGGFRIHAMLQQQALNMSKLLLMMVLKLKLSTSYASIMMVQRI